MKFTWNNKETEDSIIYKSYKYDYGLIVADQSDMYDKMSDGQLVKGDSEPSRLKVDDAVYSTGQIILKYIEWIFDNNNDFILFGFGEHEDIADTYMTIFDDAYEGAYFQPELYKSHGHWCTYTHLNFEYDAAQLNKLLSKGNNPFTFDALLAGMEIPKEKTEDIIKLDYFDENERNIILESGISGFCSIRDFDGVEFFSKSKNLDEINTYLTQAFHDVIVFK
ncbi:MAG: hypothetical protein WCX65_07440 [bacterium]